MATPTLITLTELARRTAIAEATLLGWGAQHGFPLPEPGVGDGHLFRAGIPALLLRAVAERDAGSPLAEALARAAAASEGTDRSIFETVRRAQPGRVRHVLAKSALLAVSRAIEDEASNAGAEVVLLGGFQRERFYRQSERRWRELAERCRCVVAFADLEPGGAADGPVEVAGSWDDPFIREWFLVCDGTDTQIVFAARERTGSSGRSDGQRVFEAIWTTDPQAVRGAMLAARVRLTSDHAVVSALLDERLAGDTPPAQPGLAERLMQRIFAAYAYAAEADARAHERRPSRPVDLSATRSRTLAMRLHDETLQRLLALRQDLEELRGGDEATLRRARGSLAHAITEVRALIADAPGPDRARGTLAAELRAVAARVTERTGIAVELRVDEAAAPGPHDELLVALAREFTTNSGLHAHASTVTVTVEHDRYAVGLTVRDDGYGFSPERRAAAAAAGHVGLTLAAERIQRVGGSLRIDAHAVGGGTAVEVVLPNRIPADGEA